ncbi:FERM domain-containing protein 4A-like isoform X2 [Eriocheir sinensis]|uniref:FERM domain-containing protein 4A-like isoform X2 n=1 Tax=Eriocheir sinensis TaxID=95602 RepID=UPI0021C8A59D|nr:FERM domain-containing protein 4A-like isoform X2 [Eriocheir sinensis]
MSRERIERRKLWMQMGAGVRVEVVLLDARRLEVHVGPRLLVQELLAMVASHFTLREHQYFSLAHLDSTGHYQWLTPERRVVDHECIRTHTGAAPLTIYFLVKFYIESILQLQGSQTVELFYQQARSLVFKVSNEAVHYTFVRAERNTCIVWIPVFICIATIYYTFVRAERNTCIVWIPVFICIATIYYTFVRAERNTCNANTPEFTCS